jgi:tRNA-modifying protein YgfZ
MINFPKDGTYSLYQPACVLRLVGEDVVDFLQGQSTADVKSLAPGAAVYGLFLDHKGRIHADATLVRLPGGGFLLVSTACPADQVRARLESFIIADDVTVADESPQWSGVALVGEAAGAWAAGVVTPDALLFPGRRARAPSWELLLPVAAARALAGRLSPGQSLDAGALELLRIRAGIARVPGDAGPSDLPQEVGLRAAVSLTKGCFLGQEIMARLASRGTTRRRLVRVSGAGTVPAVPAALERGGAAAGELRSVVATPEGFEGLALVSVRSLPGPYVLSGEAAPSIAVNPQDCV